MSTAGQVISELSQYASPERKKTNEWFFKTGPGEYGEGDVFIGLSMPNTRKVSKQFKDLPLPEIQKLLENEVHEVRLCALCILVLQYKTKNSPKETLVQFYLQNTPHINNWDLVDCSAHYIVGQSILDGINDESLLFDLAQSTNMWERRISIVATWILIRDGNIQTTLNLSKSLIHNTEDLMHKAVGWMLREAWKVRPEPVEAFLIQHYDDIPRTTLRYTIERMPESQRKQFLHKKF